MDEISLYDQTINYKTKAYFKHHTVRLDWMDVQKKVMNTIQSILLELNWL